MICCRLIGMIVKCDDHFSSRMRHDCLVIDMLVYSQREGTVMSHSPQQPFFSKVTPSYQRCDRTVERD